MKKNIALLLTLVLLLALAACGKEGGTAAQGGAQLPSVSGDGWQQVSQDAPFGQYHTEEELLEMLESGDFSAYLPVDPALPADPVDTGGDEPYKGFSNALTFSDGGSGEGVEFMDFAEQLTPEQQKDLEEMAAMATDPEMAEIFGN